VEVSLKAVNARRLDEEEVLRRRLEEHLQTAEEYMKKGQGHRAYMEFEKAAALLEAAGRTAQLEQLWRTAATGFTAAEAYIQAGRSHLHIARIESAAGRKAEARDSYLAAANAMAAARHKERDTWIILTQALEQAIQLTLDLGETAQAIDLLVKCAQIHANQTGYTLEAINCLERAKQLLQQVPDHPHAEIIEQQLHQLLSRTR